MPTKAPVLSERLREVDEMRPVSSGLSIWENDRFVNIATEFYGRGEERNEHGTKGGFVKVKS